jgi:F0F1-type ATP synthase alpha subunit
LAAEEFRLPVLDVGTVVSIGDGIARVYGCEACLAGELLEFADVDSRMLEFSPEIQVNSTLLVNQSLAFDESKRSSLNPFRKFLSWASGERARNTDGC